MLGPEKVHIGLVCEDGIATKKCNIVYGRRQHFVNILLTHHVQMYLCYLLLNLERQRLRYSFIKKNSH